MSAIQTTNLNTLTLGGNSTGNIIIDTAGAPINIGSTNATTLNLGHTVTGTTNVNGGNVNLNGNTNVSSGNTFTVVSGQAAITGQNSGGATTLRVNNHTSGGSIAVFQNAATDVFSILNGGNVAATKELSVLGNVSAGTTTSLTPLFVDGQNSKGRSAFVVDQTASSSNDILSASSSGVTKFTIANNGNITTLGF